MLVLCAQKPATAADDEGGTVAGRYRRRHHSDRHCAGLSVSCSGAADTHTHIRARARKRFKLLIAAQALNDLNGQSWNMLNVKVIT